MRQVNVGQYLVNQALPEKYRDYSRTIDSEGLHRILDTLARELKPSEYRDTLQKLYQIGAQVGYYEGASFSWNDLKTPPKTKALRKELERKVEAIMSDRSLSDAAKDDQVVKVTESYRKRMLDTMLAEAKKSGSGFVQQIESKTRGKPADLQSLLIGDVLMADSSGKVVPVPQLRGFSEGVSPADYWVNSYGTRKGVADVKLATADAGYASKKLKQIASREVVTTHDCGTTRGMLVDGGDPDNVGSVLAAPVAGFDAGEVVTASMLRKLKGKRISVRSPTTCSAEQGICAKCAGVRESGDFPEIGDHVGSSSAQAVGEKATQTALSCLEMGTLVRMADLSVKPIEKIVAGDHVVGCDLKGRVFPTKVTRTYDQGPQPVVAHEFRNRNGAPLELRCTKTHVVMASRTGEPGFSRVPAGSVAGNTRATVATPGPGGSGYPEPVELLRATPAGERPCFDIEVEHEDSLFLLANGLVVSNSKHSAGRTDGGDQAQLSGFKLIEQYIDMPSHFVGQAALASSDGKVTAVEKAPQGGWNIAIGDDVHYTPQDRRPIVKVGDEVEAGDPVSDGIVNPNEYVRFKGIGATRSKLVEQLREATGAHRRNVEVLVRPMLNYVKVDEPDAYPGSAPGDVVHYSRFVQHWKPRPGAVETSLVGARGKYLDAEAGHFTIGTRITPKVADSLKRLGVKKVVVHDDPAPFTPVIPPGVRSLFYAPDWQERLGGYYLKSSLVDAAERGMESAPKSVSYIPGLLRGTGFGDELRTKGVY